MPNPAPAGAPGAPTATRRTALAATGVGLVLAGCGQPRPGLAGDGGDTAPQTARTAQTGRIAQTDQSDEAILATARAELSAMVTHVAAVRRRHQDLRRRLAPLQEAHEAQRGVLDPEALDPEAGVVAPDPSPATVPEDSGDALARVRGDEERLQRRLVTWAVAVDSGPLARLLAALSAGLAQQLTLLDGQPV